jgi:hypothetical protein
MSNSTDTQKRIADALAELDRIQKKCRSKLAQAKWHRWCQESCEPPRVA